MTLNFFSILTLSISVGSLLCSSLGFGANQARSVEHLSTTSEVSNVQIDDLEELGFKIVGSGPQRVIVLHSWFSDCSSYLPMEPYLDTATFTFAFVDLRGYGLSQHLQGAHNLDEAAQDVCKIADFLGWKEYHIIGHSMSGMIAQKIACIHPSAVKSVVAITPVPASGSPKSPLVMDFLKSAAIGNDSYAKECFHLLTGRLYSDSIAQKLIDHWRSCSNLDARLDYLEMFSNTDFSSSAKGLKTPMLVIITEHDFPGEEEHMRNTFLSWYPNAKLICCPAAGHFPAQEIPMYLVSIIEQFLSGFSAH